MLWHASVAKAHDDVGRVPSAPAEAENERIHNALSPTRQINSEARDDAFDQTKRLFGVVLFGDFYLRYYSADTWTRRMVRILHCP